MNASHTAQRTQRSCVAFLAYSLRNAMHTTQEEPEPCVKFNATSTSV